MYERKEEGEAGGRRLAHIGLKVDRPLGIDHTTATKPRFPFARKSDASNGVTC